MHRDKKIGFALGILLLGIVAAFFFRNEPDPFAELPPLDDPAGLDAEIAENPISPYSEKTDPNAREAPAVSQAKNPWDVPEIYPPNYQPPVESAGLPIAPGAPAPISLAEPVPIPASETQPAIEVRNPFSELMKSQPKPERPLPGNEKWTAGPVKPEKAPAQTPPANLVKTAPPVAETPASQTSLYKIVPGDTLSVLAEKHLGSSRRYMELYEANRDKLRNPDDIKVGMLIRIPPRVKFDAPSQSARPSARPTFAAPETITPENTTPFHQDATNVRPAPAETSRFMPFSRSPLGPVPH